MKYKITLYLGLMLTGVIFLNSNCRRDPQADFSLVAGYVIGKEICNTDSTKDYWLVDLSYLNDTPQYGDSLFLDGQYYINVVKTKGLPSDLKEVGKKVTIQFKVITPNKIETIGCNVANPTTYFLKEIFVINTGEIR